MGVDVGDVVSEAPRTTGLAIGHDPDRLDVAIGLEELVEVLLRECFNSGDGDS